MDMCRKEIHGRNNLMLGGPISREGVEAEKAQEKTMIEKLEQCNATFNGMRCEQDKYHHRKCGRTPKHNCGGSSWTDAGAKRAESERTAA
jgi:hypothetical protein